MRPGIQRKKKHALIYSSFPGLGLRPVLIHGTSFWSFTSVLYFLGVSKCPIQQNGHEFSLCLELFDTNRFSFSPLLPLVTSPYCLLSFKTLHSHSFLEAVRTSLASYSCFIASWNIWAQHHFLNVHMNVSVGSRPSESFQGLGYVFCFVYTSLHAKRSQVCQAVAL